MRYSAVIYMGSFTLRCGLGKRCLKLSSGVQSAHVTSYLSIQVRDSKLHSSRRLLDLCVAGGNQPMAISQVCAKDKIRASSNMRPDTISPTGNPSASPIGILSEGCPVMSNGVVLPSIFQQRRSLSLSEPSGANSRARLGEVGITRKSTSLSTRSYAVRRHGLWFCALA